MKHFAIIMVSVACAASVSSCQPASDGKSEFKEEIAAENTGSATDSKTNTDSGTGTGSGSGTGTETGTGTGSGTGTGTGSGTEEEALKLSISGTVKFLLPDQNGFQTNVEVPEATVFLEGFADQEVTSGPDGAFTILLTIPGGVSLDGPSYRVVAWKIDGANHKYGIAKDAIGAVPGTQFVVGEMKIGYTALKRFIPEGPASAAVDRSTCEAVILGYESKVPVVYDSLSTFLEVDYLPEGTYNYTLTCDGFKPKSGTFDVTGIDQNAGSFPNWSEVQPRPVLEPL